MIIFLTKCALHIKEQATFKMTIQLEKKVTSSKSCAEAFIQTFLCVFLCVKSTNDNDITLEWDRISCKQQLQSCIFCSYFRVMYDVSWIWTPALGAVAQTVMHYCRLNLLLLSSERSYEYRTSIAADRLLQYFLRWHHPLILFERIPRGCLSHMQQFTMHESKTTILSTVSSWVHRLQNQKKIYLNGIVGVITVSFEPVLLSRSLLTVGTRDVESDWSMPKDTQKSANQRGWQIQVVNPDPVCDCNTAQSSLLSLEALALPRLLPFPRAAIKARRLAVWKSGKGEKNDLKRQRGRPRDGTRGGGSCSAVCMDHQLPSKRRTKEVNMRLVSAKWEKPEFGSEWVSLVWGEAPLVLAAVGSWGV